jgi:hypothetical protein
VFEFLKTNRRKTDQGDNSSGESQFHSSVPASSQQHTSTHRDLARVVLRDTLRNNGIPTEWISCEPISRSRSKGDNSLFIQLVIQRWHEGLLQYAPLLQQQMLQGLQRFDPASDHSGHVVVWKFSPNCGYPHTAMPASDFWIDKVAGASKPKFDLPPSGLDHRDDGFVPTIPSELR